VAATFYHVLVGLLFLVAFAGLYLAAASAMAGDLVARVAPLLESPTAYVKALFDAGVPGYRPFVTAVVVGVFASLVGLWVGFRLHHASGRWLNSEGQSLEESRGYVVLWITFWITIASAVAASWYWVQAFEQCLAILAVPLGVYVGGQLTTLA